MFHPGEQLRLVISTRDELGAIMPGTRDYVPCHCGEHVVHTGAEDAPYLQLPVEAP